MQVNDLFEDLRDGYNLITLLEILSQHSISAPMVIFAFKNFKKILNFIIY